MVDSNVFFDLFRKSERIIDWFKGVQPSQILVSRIVHLEIFLSPLKQTAKEQFVYISGDFKTVVPNDDVFAQTCKVLREWDHTHSKPNLADALIGVNAKMLGCPVVTSNKGDFENIKGLEIIVP